MASDIQAGFLLYRYNKEEQLEVCLVTNEDNDLMMPQRAEFERSQTLEAMCQELERLTGVHVSSEDIIPLEVVKCVKTGKKFLAYALETDWEKLPETSKRHKIKKYGTYVAMKKAFKKVMPAQYEMLKELQDVLSIRNLIRYM